MPLGEGDGPGWLEIITARLGTSKVALEQENGIGIQIDGQCFCAVGYYSLFTLLTHHDSPLPSGIFSTFSAGCSPAAIRNFFNDGLLWLGGTLSISEGKMAHADFTVRGGNGHRNGYLQHSGGNRRVAANPVEFCSHSEVQCQKEKR